MANKFQKSVLERLEQEAVRQKENVKEKNDPGQTEAPAVPGDASEPEVKTIRIEEAPQKQAPSSETEPEAPAGAVELRALPDVSGYLRRDTQRLAKNKTFYLDAELIEAIKATAKSQNVTDSKLVNDILRRVLGLE